MSLAVTVSPLEARHSWIANREVPGRAGVREAVNPATGAAFAEASLLDAAQMGEALAAAGAAFPAWSALTFQARARFLMQAHAAVLEEAEDIARLIEREQGKPAGEAHLVEIFPALEGLKHLALHAEELLRDDLLETQVILFAHKEARLIYAPVGVVLAITPWNYPFSISLSGVATALAAGNTVVLKPAPATTLIGLKIGDIFRKAGIPEGVVNVVAVDDALAPALVEDPRVARIVFTGSVGTGKRVMAAASRNLTPVVLELGGKDAAIVCQDADLDRAARGLVWGAFMNAGQTCASVERVYVEEPIADALISRIVTETRKLRLGDPAQGEVDLGPMTMERQRKLVEGHVQDALARGAIALTGGSTPSGPGYYYPPTVLTNVDHGMRIMTEETFGPVLPIMRVATVEEGIRLANESPYGLTASGWTRDPELARRLQRELQAGVVTINDCVYSYAEPTAPWGGVKHSGIGRTHGLAGLREMVQVKHVSSDYGTAPNLWWYPYGGDFHRLMAASSHALHGHSLWSRLRGQLTLVRSARFWKRARIGGILRNVDKLFT